MTKFICVTCGAQFRESQAPPPSCPICCDERQFIGWDGQSWTTLDKLAKTHRLSFEEEDEGVLGIRIEPHFGIGQRALLLHTKKGNLLWDCVTLIDAEAIVRIKALGGVQAIAVSHPHYYTGMAEWSDAFGGAPIYLHADDMRWVTRPHPAIVYWGGETHPLMAGATLIRCGGHFPGGTVLHWAKGARGRGALFCGDIIQVSQDRASVSFMYSYPNYIPLNAAAVNRIAAAVAPYAFEVMLGAFPKRNIVSEGRATLDNSIIRYLKAVG
jgi:hypothetical protein